MGRQAPVQPQNKVLPSHLLSVSGPGCCSGKPVCSHWAELYSGCLSGLSCLPPHRDWGHHWACWYPCPWGLCAPVVAGPRSPGATLALPELGTTWTPGHLSWEEGGHSGRPLPPPPSGVSALTPSAPLLPSILPLLAPLLSPSLPSLSPLTGLFCLCVSVPHAFPSRHISHPGKQSFAKTLFGLILGLCSLLPARCVHPFLLGPPPPCPPAPPPQAQLSPDRWRAASTPSLKQHLIAVFCSWTSKLGLRPCAGVAGVWALGERR